ncbi:MAG: hypothetical protein IK990_08165 [Ruminiclostridium sp.]|nr:hypothetical protein [Ruminiclostridium sp.]
MSIRDEAERVVRELGIDKKRFHEVSKLAYADIIRRTENEFASGGTLHRCWDGRLQKQLSTKDISSDRLWYHKLPELLPADEPVYALLEDTRAYEPEYRVFEAHLPELITVLDEINGLGEFYIVSGKYKWLICETHEDIVCCAGEIPAK